MKSTRLQDRSRLMGAVWLRGKQFAVNGPTDDSAEKNVSRRPIEVFRSGFPAADAKGID
jgi:hypothetical protein